MIAFQLGTNSADLNNPMIPSLYNQILSTIAPIMGTAGLTPGGGGAAKPDAKASAGPHGKAAAGLPLPQPQPLLQPPPPQVLVIERMHSGARRFVVLDFGKPVLLTDVIIPACGDLASLSIGRSGPGSL